jgi:hypothetical protein|uniref:Uncharacterized protein n=1 Tax=Zea mays TaxID=4577 RepID=A0A804QGB3_MAIZE
MYRRIDRSAPGPFLQLQTTARSSESEDGQLDPIGALGGHGERAVDEVLGLAVHALVHLEQLRLAVRVAVALEVGREAGPLRDGVPDAVHRVRVGVGRHDPGVREDRREVVPRPELQRAREVVVRVQVGAGAVLLPLVAPELEAAPVLARQRRPAPAQRRHQVPDVPGAQLVAAAAAAAVLRPALAPPPHGGEEGVAGAEHRAGEAAALAVVAAAALGVVGPQPVDAERRRRLARAVREAATLPRVAERARPLHACIDRQGTEHTVRVRLDSCVVVAGLNWSEERLADRSVDLRSGHDDMPQHLLDKVEEIELLRGGRVGEERREQHDEGDRKLHHPCQLAVSLQSTTLQRSIPPANAYILPRATPYIYNVNNART